MRLEQEAGLNPNLLMKFQFHKGAIRTEVVDSFNPGIVLFQFHKGAIRTRELNSLIQAIPHFNSIKVRLELASCFNCLSIASISIP